MCPDGEYEVQMRPDCKVLFDSITKSLSRIETFIVAVLLSVAGGAVTIIVTFVIKKG